MIKVCIVFLFLFVFSASAHASDELELEDAINFYCLKKSYPQIVNLEKDAKNKIWLNMRNGQKVLYFDPHLQASGLATDIKSAMNEIYPLEPARSDAQPYSSPGRKRSYDLFDSLYGANPAAVKSQLGNMKFMGKNMQLSQNAARDFAKVAKKLESMAAANKAIKKFLVPEGGYYWRKIAGEDVLSPHSYGIALDLGVNASPYWRWSKQMPHPLQSTYPSEIVRLMEDNGFIWGGKWHEYDIMHFEYRPELICKAAMYKPLRKAE